MAGPPTRSDARLTMVFIGGSAPSKAVCTLGLHKDSGDFTNADMAPLVDAVKPMHGLLSTSSCRLDLIELKVGPEAIGPTYTANVGYLGLGLSASVPPNTAVLIRKELADISAKFAGRMYWPGMPEDKVDSSGSLDTAWVSQAQTATDAFMTDLEEAGVTPVVFGSAPGVSPVTHVSRLTVIAIAATQRRRLRR